VGTVGEYGKRERLRAAAWKRVADDLPPRARAAGRFVGRRGVEVGPPVDYCLPASRAVCNLLPEVREDALGLFAELGIPWHSGIDGGPGNHLLSSQVQCVNALGQMVADPGRIVAAFSPELDIAEVLEVEPGRYLTFEYIGPTDYFGEVPRGVRVRGSLCTSVDAAFLYRTSAGVTELALVEWKYTEAYEPRKPDPKDSTRIGRYGAAHADPGGPIISDLLPIELMLDEPLYQLMRQQLLADRLERDQVLGAQRVRVLHVAPAANLDYQRSLHRPEQRALGATVYQAWASLLRRPDRFIAIDSARFCDSAITSRSYDHRYGDYLVADRTDAERLFDGDVDNHLYSVAEFDGDAEMDDGEVQIQIGNRATILEYPFHLFELYEAADDLLVEFEAEPD
jgi:hypothetical protein